MTFSLLSPARAETKERGGKPETIVVVETLDDSIRELQPGELVHLRDEQGQNCKAGCGKGMFHMDSGPWTDNADLWSRHPVRCQS